MGTKNYKLIYDMQEYQEAIYEAGRAVLTAQVKESEAKEKYKEMVVRLSEIPENQLLFSEDHCYARGITKHVFHMRNASNTGNGHNVCIFCGTDDFQE